MIIKQSQILYFINNDECDSTCDETKIKLFK